jgi:16S rRNA (cytosine967-C5)-methyltransferase
MLGEDKTAWFDLVLLDVPCTGTGTLRRNPGIKWVLTEQMLSELLEKQQIIMEENARFVKRGGTLLYATCSLLKEEGEDQMKWFTSVHPEFTLEETLRTRPDLQGCDGFFVARLRKATKI